MHDDDDDHVRAPDPETKCGTATEAGFLGYFLGLALVAIDLSLMAVAVVL